MYLGRFLIDSQALWGFNVTWGSWEFYLTFLDPRVLMSYQRLILWLVLVSQTDQSVSILAYSFTLLPWQKYVSPIASLVSLFIEWQLYLHCNGILENEFCGWIINYHLVNGDCYSCLHLYYTSTTIGIII